MYIADSHTHSSCSDDGTVPMRVMAEAAVQAGLSALTITDHCDFLSLKGNQRTTVYDWAPVLAQREEMLSAFGGKALDLPLGLEFGTPFIEEEAAETVSGQPELDFIIGSVHNFSEDAGGLDFCYADYSTEENCYRALDNYFASMLRLAAGKYYDVLGHIIYPLRYMKGRYREPISLHRYTDHIRMLLRLAAESGRGIELNTWKGQTIREWIPVLKLYREAGGEILTVGSDAHAPGPVGSGVVECYRLMEDLGFRYVAVYHERKPGFIKL